MFFARAYCHRHDELAGFGLADRCQRTCTHVHDVRVDIAVLSVRNVDERLGLRHGCNSNYTQEREHVARRSTPWRFLSLSLGLAAFKWFLKRQERRPHPLRTCYRKRSRRERILWPAVLCGAAAGRDRKLTRWARGKRLSSCRLFCLRPREKPTSPPRKRKP